MEKEQSSGSKVSATPPTLQTPQAAPFFKPYELPLENKPVWANPYQKAYTPPEGAVVYLPDGTRVGQFGKSTQVWVLKPGYSLQQAQIALYAAQKGYLTGDMSQTALETACTPLGITEAELFTRAFLVAIRYAEADNKQATPYDRQYGGGTFKGKDLNNDKVISEQEKYADHPRENITKWGNTQDVAGAYQFKSSSWSTAKKQLGLKDFSPASQDQAALYLIREQEKWNPRAKGVIADITQGNASVAFTKLNGTWTSLPEGKEVLVTADEALTRYKEGIVNELNNRSELKSPKGSLKL